MAQIRQIGRTFEFVDADAAVQRLKASPPNDARRSFALVTFDDGFRDFLGVMDELLRLEIPACLYIVTEFLGRSGYLKASDVRSISQAFDLRSHTTSHPKLVGVNQSELTREIDDSKHYLEDLIGKAVVHFAAPFRGSVEFRRVGDTRCCRGVRDVPDNVSGLEHTRVAGPGGCSSATS
ncbi:MAG: polysaccharide deacetylase family protein [Acidimicrobiia bacterium]